jgi:hypothetical protein
MSLVACMKADEVLQPSNSFAQANCIDLAVEERPVEERPVRKLEQSNQQALPQAHMLKAPKIF